MSDSTALPTTDDLLPAIAVAVIRDIASLTTQSVLYGMYLIVFPVAFFNLLKRRDERPWLVLTIATTLMFAISSFIWAANIAVLVKRLGVVFSDTDLPILSRLDLADSSVMKITYAGNVIFVFSYVIGDAVLAWRILVLCQWALWQSVAMIGLWLGTTAMALGFFGCIAHANFPEDEALPRLCNELGNSGWVVSLAFNGLATALLARIALSHRKVSMVLDPKRNPSSVHRVLRILVVSSIIYFLLGVPRLTSFGKLTLNPTASKFTYATQIIEGMLAQLVGLYPTAVTTFLFYESKILGQTSSLHSATMTGASIEFHTSATAGRGGLFGKPKASLTSNSYSSAATKMGSMTPGQASIDDMTV